MRLPGKGFFAQLVTHSLAQFALLLREDQVFTTGILTTVVAAVATVTTIAAIVTANTATGAAIVTVRIVTIILSLLMLDAIRSA
jgi:hypothetical protein